MSRDVRWNPAEDYEEKLQEYHNISIERGLAQNELMYVPELVLYGQELILRYYSSSEIKSSCQTKAEYYLKAIETAIRGGIIFGAQWESNGIQSESKLPNEKKAQLRVSEILRIGIDKLSKEAIQNHQQLNDSELRHLSEAIFNCVGSYWNIADDTLTSDGTAGEEFATYRKKVLIEEILNNTLASYLIGVSLIITAKGRRIYKHSLSNESFWMNWPQGDPLVIKVPWENTTKTNSALTEMLIAKKEKSLNEDVEREHLDFWVWSGMALSVIFGIAGPFLYNGPHRFFWLLLLLPPVFVIWYRENDYRKRQKKSAEKKQEASISNQPRKSLELKPKDKTKIKCPSCHRKLVEDSSFCSYCGSPLLGVCLNCGTELPWGVAFCHKCGKSVRQ